MSLKFKLTMTQLAEQTDGHICPVTVICTMALSLINGLTFTKHKFIKLKALSGALMACLLVSIFLMLHSAKAAEINPPDLLDKIAKIQRETESEFHNIQTDIPEQHEQRYKPLSIGTDFVDHEKSLDFYKSKFDVFILGIATPDCNECDEMETLLDQFTRLCAMKEIEYKGKNVPVVRIDGRKYINMINHEQIFFKDRPLIGLFSKGVYYNYEKGPHLNLFLHFINRHLYPIVILSSKEAIENFRNTTKEWVENTPFYRGKYRNIEDLFPEFTKVTRVIAFVAQKGEYKYELSQLSNSAKKLGYRDDLRIAKVVDPALVKEYKESMKKKWFEPKSINSIVVFSKDKSPEDNLNSLDLSIDGGVNFEHWINSASIEPIEELTVQTLQIMLPMYMPIFAVFIDKNYAIYGSKSFNILNIIEILN